MAHRSSTVLIALLVVCACSSPPPPQPSTPPVAAQAAPPAELTIEATDPRSAPAFRVDVGCSETSLRTVIATLTWQAGRSLVTSQRIDVTVFKDGFERGLFASVPADRGGKFELAPGLLKMERPPGRAFDLVAVPRQDERKELAAVEVQNLEPGLLYRWRVVTRKETALVTSQVVEVQAPVCIGDEREGH